jgi:peptidoglycan-associated lipoprotein
MISPSRTKSWSTAVVALLVIVLAASACSRKKPPTTEIRTETGADTAAYRPGADTAAVNTRDQRINEARGTIAERIYFDFNRSEIKPEYSDVLQRKAEVMNEFPEIAIRIEGHCDERGTVEYNLALGERRAQAAKDYLVNLGLDPDRISTISYGEERPAIDGHDEEAWAQNRRDEFVITSEFGA